MIRLPPSGISISQDDLNLHLQHLDIYYGLLKQGFKKKEILRYFNERGALTRNRATRNILPPDRHPSPSSKQKEYARCEHNGIKNESTFLMASPTIREVQEGTSDALDSAPTVSRENISSSDTSKTLSCSQSSTPNWRNPEPSSAIPAQSYSHSHMPRRSSLLRFARSISSDSFEDDMRSSVTFSPNLNKTYKARIQKHSHGLLELDISNQPTSQGRSLSEELEHLTLSEELLPVGRLLKVISPRSSSLSPLAQEFSPLRLPPPVTSKPQNSLSSASTPSPRHPEQDIHSYRSGPIDNSTSELSFTTATYSPEFVEQHESQLPSSPPVVAEGSVADESLSRPSSPSLSVVPLTPKLVRRTAPRTEPRQGTSRYLDGTFTVYNDSLPANIQPQSSIELARNTPVSEYNVAYTAPPGMVYSEFARRGHLAYHLRQASGEQSPTSRALVIRERRQREFIRSAQVEGLRIGRVRRRHVPEAAMGQVGVDNRTTNDPQEGMFEIWRDDLDADRVGEENFDDVGRALAEVGFGMRTFSGNQRAAT